MRGTSIPSGTYSSFVGVEEVRSSTRILQNALQLFSSKGYEATSVREICEASGLTKPALYHFFGSKEGVYRALVEGALQEFHAELLARLSGPGGCAQRLRGMARRYFAYAEERRDLARFLMALIHNPGSAPPTDFAGFYRQLLEGVARCLDEGVARGELRPGRNDVRLINLMGSLGEALCGCLILGEPRLTPELADALVDSLLDGWAARPAPEHA